MDTKICFKCGKEKSLDDFYKHKQMKDGRLNKCKSCTKSDSENQRQKNLKKEGWHEKEKARQRYKYYRLNYKSKHKPTSEKKHKYISTYKNKYPEKVSAMNKSSSLFKKGFEKHHWSYNVGDEKDVIWMTKQAHSFLHRFLIYDEVKFMYRTLKGNLLDSREKHIKYYLSIKHLPF